MAELLLLVDGNNLAYRSRYTQGDKRGAQGRPSGVVYGSLQLLRQLLQRFNPAGVLVAFDGGRHEKTRIDPTYKGHRGRKVLPKAPTLSPLGKVPRFIRTQRMPRVGGRGRHSRWRRRRCCSPTTVSWSRSTTCTAWCRPRACRVCA